MPILIGILVFVLVVLYTLYASIIRKKNAVEESFSGIDVQLKKRHDLIPNLIATAQKFMDHEKDLLEGITRLRTSAMELSDKKDVAGALAVEAQLGDKLSQLRVTMENYPNLKSDTTMISVQAGLTDTEEHIAASRRFYNSAVRQLNDSIQVWPMSMMAGWLAVKNYPYFEAQTAEREAPQVAQMFK